MTVCSEHEVTRGRLLVVGLLVLMGCARRGIAPLYSGPERPLDQVAVLSGFEAGAFADEATVRILRVGRHKVSPEFLGAAPRTVAVEPGAHIVDITLSRADTISDRPARIRVPMEAGGRYEIHASRIVDVPNHLDPSRGRFVENGHWQPWVLDVRTGAVVAGARPH